MKKLLIVAALISLLALCGNAYDGQNVGGSFGRSWLAEHGATSSAADTNNSLWNWGGSPKGYVVSNGRLYSTANAPIWYYPFFQTNTAPIVINRSSTNSMNQVPTDFLLPNIMYEDPWLLAQLTERPVVVVDNIQNF